jgi:PAS domain S-box-containing protein
VCDVADTGPMAEPEAKILGDEFRLLADNMPVMCWIADATGYIHWYNKRWYEYSGTTPAQMEGWGWQSVHDPRTLDAVLERWNASLASAEPFEMVFPLRNAAGEYRPFLTRIQPYFDAQGCLRHWFGNNVDITAQRAAEQALSNLNAGLEHRVREEIRSREMAQAQLAQSEKLSALGQLAGGVAHDFNNVVQAIASYANVLERGADFPPKVRSLGEKLLEVSKRGCAITRRLLAFARRDDLHSESIDVGALLKGAHELLSHTIRSSISLRLDLAEGLQPVLADKCQLEVALVNLATNAQDAIIGDGVITLSAAPDTVLGVEHPAGLAPGDYVRIEVADTGAGMDAATLTRAMEPFFTTKERGKGTGMGLAMVRGFADQSGGALEISSELGRGTRVTLWMPVCGSTITPIDQPQTVHNVGFLHRLLVVDDDQAVREALTEQLVELGYEVIQAENGAVALALLDAESVVDLVVCDLSMPGMNGLALIRAAQGRRPNLPAILLTGYAGDAEALAFGLKPATGPISLLRKPVMAAELGTEIEALLTLNQ